MTPDPLQKAILLDMDGVLVDFFGATLALHGREDLLDRWPAGEWDMARVLGLDGRDFWDPIAEAGASFWIGLEWYPWADELLELCEEVGGFVIATSPSRDPASAAGKMHCLRERFGKKFRDYMIGPHKALMAGCGMVLIDDRDTGVASFRAAGGRALRFPQLWNADHALAANPLEVVREQLPSLLAARSLAPRP